MTGSQTETAEQEPTTREDFKVWLEAEGYYDVHYNGDHWHAARALAFHWTVHGGEIFDTCSHIPRFRYCYQTETLARAALNEWASRNFEDEPLGWHRHPSTSRRRRNGNPAEEYIET